MMLGHMGETHTDGIPESGAVYDIVRFRFRYQRMNVTILYLKVN